MHQAESSSAVFCLWTALSLSAALHPVSRRPSCLPLPTDQCFCPMRTFNPLLLRTLRRTSQGPSDRVVGVTGAPGVVSVPPDLIADHKKRSYLYQWLHWKTL